MSPNFVVFVTLVLVFVICQWFGAMLAIHIASMAHIFDDQFDILIPFADYDYDNYHVNPVDSHDY